MKKTIITISREYGSGGRLIGERVAKELGIAFYNRNLIDLSAQRSGLAKEYIGQWEERLSSRFVWAPVTMGRLSLGGLHQSCYSNQDKMYLTQSTIIREFAQMESCVIVGRCADQVLRETESCMNVFIHAALETRVARLVREYGVDEKTAAADARRTDKGRSNYYQYYTGANWGERSNYHLMMDSGIFGVEDTVKLIVQAAQSLR